MHPSRTSPSLRLALLAALALTPGTGVVAAPASAPQPGSADATAWLARRWAESDLERLAAAARAWRDAKGSWPADCREAWRALQPPPAADPWGSPYSCRVEGNSLLVSSPGPDGRAGSADDLTRDASTAQALVATGTGQASPQAPSAPAGGAPEAAPPPPASPEEAATAETLRILARALESFRQKESRYPVTDKVEHLERWLVSEHLAMAAWSSKDAWGRPLRYRTTDVGTSYSLASAGSDGRWEAVTPGAPWPSEGGDLVIADGEPVRWPPALSQAPRPAASDAAPSAGAAPTTAAPADPAELSRQRVAQFAAAAARNRAGGRFVESDDAERLAREWGGVSASDGWGRPLHYLSADGGRRCAIASAGANGRLDAGMESYARGAAAAGDDIVTHGGSPD